jgi:hypothetical protein
VGKPASLGDRSCPCSRQNREILDYTHAVARWKHYAQALAPLLAQLEVGEPNNPIPEC